MIRLQHIDKSFDSRAVFSDFSCEFESEKPNCILGESGCGKTTLLRMLLGLEKPDRGEISGLHGRPAVLFQEDRLCESFSALRNIRLVSPKLPRELVLEEMQKLGLPLLPQPVRTLSGGEKRRVAILRAALYEGDYFVFDEPFRGLDIHTRDLTQAYLMEKTAGKTVLVVTHDPQEAQAWGGTILKLT